MKLKFKIKQVRPHIFLFEHTDQYDMCMTHLRSQEFYESPNPKFRGKDSFSLIDFMDWYRKDHKDVFTYPNDWGGFNVPSESVQRLYDLSYPSDENGCNLPDKNKYDEAMISGYFKCRELLGEHNRERFYIIGALKTNKKAILHEIAHGFFYTTPEYKKEMTDLVKELKPSFRKEINGVLKKLGYTSKVYVDETQAYLATGAGKDYFKSLKNQNKPFIKVFEKYYKK